MILPLSANIIWPGLYLHQYLFSLYSIIPALIVEWIAIKWIFGFSLQRSFVIAVTINAISAILGYFMFIYASLLFTFGMGLLLDRASFGLLRLNTFGCVSWFLEYVFAALFTSILEYYAIRFIFKIKFSLKSQSFFYFLLANAVSVSISFIMMYYEQTSKGWPS